MSTSSITSTHKGVRGTGRKWARVTLQNGELNLETRLKGCTGSLAADIQHKLHRKHLANFMSPSTNLPLILMKPGPSQVQILAFEPVTGLRCLLYKISLSSLKNVEGVHK